MVGREATSGTQKIHIEDRLLFVLMLGDIVLKTIFVKWMLQKNMQPLNMKIHFATVATSIIAAVVTCEPQ